MSRKKLLIIGFIIILLIVIPLTIFLLKQQQDVRSKAEAATILSLEPASTPQAPISKRGGETVNLDVVVDPGVNKNSIIYLKLEILYDPTKLATGGATPQEEPFLENTASLVLSAPPEYSPGKILLTLSTGVDPTKIIQRNSDADPPTIVGTLNFKAIGDTAGQPTQISFGPATSANSQGTEDGANENVIDISSLQGSFVVISGNAAETDQASQAQPTPTTAPNAVVTAAPTTTIANNTSSNPTTSTSSQSASSSTTTNSSSSSSDTSIPPVCSALDLDRTPNGAAPFAITLTARGTDDDSAISKATFAFGDGQVTDVTTGGGLGTENANVAIAHVYNNPGTFTASVIFTDSTGEISSGTCSQTITVTDSSSTASTTTTDTSSASLPATGPGDVILGVGAVVTVLTIIGGIIFFIL